MKTLARIAVIGLALAVGLPSVSSADDDAIKMQGKGARRTALDEMSYKPFDTALLDQLDWAKATPVSADTLKGKPALIVSWASWFKTSHAAATQADALKKANPDLIVVLVHQQRGFEKSAETLKSLNASLSSAHDKSGEVFKALRVEGASPCFFVIDKAGNLRFADVEKGSIEAAVKLVSGESASDAEKARPKAKPQPGGPGAAKNAKPTPEQYLAAKWPKHAPKGDIGAKDLQGKPIPVALGNETWITPKVNTEGKVLVLDFWATWCGPCIAASPALAEMQEKHKDKAVVLAISGQKVPNRPEDVAAIKKFLGSKKPGYSHVNDTKQNVYKAFDPKGIPHAVILSTDGVVRWQGHPLDPGFKAALDTVVEVDPGIKVGKAASGDGAAPKP